MIVAHHHHHHPQIAQPLPPLPQGLTIIQVLGAELFTSNTAYMVIAAYEGKTDLSSVLRSWAINWTFNMVGAVGLVMLIKIADMAPVDQMQVGC